MLVTEETCEDVRFMITNVLRVNAYLTSLGAKLIAEFPELAVTLSLVDAGLDATEENIATVNRAMKMASEVEFRHTEDVPALFALSRGGAELAAFFGAVPAEVVDRFEALSVSAKNGGN